jgi:hypothetical protein
LYSRRIAEIALIVGDEFLHGTSIQAGHTDAHRDFVIEFDAGLGLERNYGSPALRTRLA